MMIYPLAIGGSCIITSIIGTWFVRLGNSKNVMNALYKGFIVSAVPSLIILYPVTDYVLGLENIFKLKKQMIDKNIDNFKMLFFEFFMLISFF